MARPPAARAAAAAAPTAAAEPADLHPRSSTRTVVLAAPSTETEDFFGHWDDSPPAAEPVDRRQEARRGVRRGALVTVVLVALAGAGVVGTQLLGDRSSGDRDAGPTTASSSPGAATSGPDVGPPGTGVPGLTAPGIHVEATPAASGDVDVVENVVFTGGATALELTLPAVTGVSEAARPDAVRITDLRVTGDGVAVDTGSASLARGGRLLLPKAPRAVELRYRLVGVVMVSRPSTPGRALVLLPPITTGDDLRRLPVVVEVRGALVRNLVCPGLAAGDQLCGRQEGERWKTVPLGSGSTAVLAQLDLPTP